MNVPKLAFYLNNLDDDLLMEAVDYRPRRRCGAVSPRVIAAACLCLLLFALPMVRLLSFEVRASIRETQQSVVVYLGDIRGAGDGYREEQLARIRTLAETTPTQPVEAILGFDDYVTEETLTTLLDLYDVSLLRVYLCIPGERERIVIPLGEGGTSGLHTLWHDRATEAHRCFSFVIRTTAETLVSMIDGEAQIAYADLKGHSGAEEYARKKGKAVVYLEAPSMPLY